MKLSIEKKERVIHLLHKGKSSSEIADELGIGKMQVAGIKAHLTLKKPEEKKKIKTSVENKIPLIWANTDPPKDPLSKNIDSSILLGTDSVFNKKVYWNFSPKTGSVNPHVLIVGETGFGKTYATQCMISELAKKDMVSIIFDYGQGFGINEASDQFLTLVEPVQIEASKNGVAINPLEIFPDDAMGPVNAAQRVADTFCRIYPRIGIQQKEALIEAIQDAFFFSDIYPDDRESWNKPLPQFSKIHDRLRAIAGSDEHTQKNYAKSVYSHINSFFRFNIIRENGEQLTWDKMFKKKGSTWIIQLKGLDYYISMIVTEMLLWNLINYLQSIGPDKLRAFVVLDEAHKLSFDKGSPVDWILREGRKFGLGGILASQQLEDYSKVAISNTSTKLIFQNHDDKQKLSKSLAKKCRNISDYRKISNIISTLSRGSAFYLNNNIGRIVKIDNIQSRGK